MGATPGISTKCILASGCGLLEFLMNGANSLDLRREFGRFALCVYKEKRESVLAPLYDSELL